MYAKFLYEHLVDNKLLYNNYNCCIWNLYSSLFDQYMIQRLVHPFYYLHCKPLKKIRFIQHRGYTQDEDHLQVHCVRVQVKFHGIYVIVTEITSYAIAGSNHSRTNCWFFSSFHGCHKGGRGVRLPPPLEFELSFICIGFSLINDVRARGWPPLEWVAPPG